MNISNQHVQQHSFLALMYEDDYFPNNLVNKGKQLLLNLCQRIEAEKPKSLTDLYQLTHHTTHLFNELDEEFQQQGSEIETVARECIVMDFEFIAHSYSYQADGEALTATREW